MLVPLMAADRLVMVGEGVPPKAALAGCETRTFCVVGSKAGRTAAAEGRPVPGCDTALRVWAG